MFKNLLASIGVGSARVDTQFERDTVRAGDSVRGEVVIYGGKVAQKVDQIYLFLVTRFTTETTPHYDYFQLADYALNDPVEIAPDEEKVVPFEVALPPDVPASVADTQVWFETGLDIKKAADPTDKDKVTVLPHPLVQTMYDAMGLLDLKLVQARNVRAFDQIPTRLPFLQEYEYEPAGGPLYGRLDDMEIIAVPEADGVNVYLEIDRRGTAIEEMSNQDVNFINFKLREGDVSGPEEMSVYFRNVIEKHL